MIELQRDSPFEMLSQISETGAQNALELPDDNAQADDWRGIGFRLAGRTFVAPMSEVDEVLTLPTYTKVPGVKSWLNGVANIRGRLLAVIDLGLMLGDVSSAKSNKRRLLAIRKDDLYSGVIVDEVLGLQTFAGQEQQDSTVAGSVVEPYVTGAFEKNGQHWSVFSLYQLAQAPEFLGVTA